MNHTRLGATVRPKSKRLPLNCRVGRVICIPQLLQPVPVDSFDMLDEIPPLSLLAEIFEPAPQNVSNREASARILSFARK